MTVAATSPTGTLLGTELDDDDFVVEMRPKRGRLSISNARRNPRKTALPLRLPPSPGAREPDPLPLLRARPDA